MTMLSWFRPRRLCRVTRAAVSAARRHDRAVASLSYRPVGVNAPVLLVGFTVFVIAIIGAIIATATGVGTSEDGGPPVWFLGLLVVVLAILSHVYLWRTAVALEIRDDQLSWRTPLRRGAMPLSDVRSIQPTAAGKGVLATITAEGQQPLMVWATKGFPAFADQIVAAAPGVQVAHGRYVRVAEKMPGGHRRGR